VVVVLILGFVLLIGIFCKIDDETKPVQKTCYHYLVEYDAAMNIKIIISSLCSS
jgi:hypothetical protein